MKNKLILTSLMILTSSLANAICPGGVCPFVPRRVVSVKRIVPLKKLVAYNIINPSKRIVTGYKVTPTRISLMIHLPYGKIFPLLRTRDYSVFSEIRKNRYAFNARVSIRNIPSTIDMHDVVIDVAYNKVQIKHYDLSGKRHIINSTIPHSILARNIEVYKYGNTIEISMVRI